MSNKYKVYICILVSALLIFEFGAHSPNAQEISDSDVKAGDKHVSNLLVDMDFKNADIRDVARAFSKISGVNIIVSDEVKAMVTLRVQSMDWREALNMILGAYNLTTLEKEKYIVITTFERRRRAEESGDLQTKVVTLNFVNVEDVQKTLASMLTGRGKIEIDKRTNSLVVTDVPEKIDKIHDVALSIDTKTPQVMIESMMLTVKLTDDEQLGIDWTITLKDVPSRSARQSLSLGKTAGLDINYGKTIFPWANLTALVEQWQEQKKVDILANPRVLTLDNLTAAIELVEQVPYQQQTTSTQSSSSIATTEFKEVPIRLYVKPHVTKDKHIFMNIKTEQSYLSGYTTDNQPIIDSRKAETNVMVRNGETIVIGGLRKKEDTITVNKTPILGNIPVLGFLFRKTIKSKVDTELLIFVTPYIAKDSSELSEDDSRQLEKANKMKAEKMKPLFKDIKDAKPFPLRPPSDIK